MGKGKIMQEIINWFIRLFLVISEDTARKKGLTHLRNIYGDEINMINCRSLWVDDFYRQYRVRELFEHKK